MDANMLLQVHLACLKVLTFSFCQVFPDLAGFRIGRIYGLQEVLQEVSFITSLLFIV